MMKLSLFLLFFLKGTSHAFSQEAVILANDGTTAPNFRIGISPLDIAGIIHEDAVVAPGFSIFGFYRPVRHLGIQAGFRMEYTDRAAAYNNVQDFEKFKGYTPEVSGTWYFSIRTKNAVDSFRLNWSATTSDVLQMLNTPVVNKMEISYGIRGGYLLNKYKAVIREVYITPLIDPSTKYEYPEVHPVVTSHVVFAGISRTAIKNLRVQYPQFGVQRKQWQRDIYIDLMYSPYIKVSDAYAWILGGYREVAVAGSSYDLQKGGIRTGILHNYFGRTVNGGIGAEAGLRPGVQKTSKSFYLQARLIFSYSGHK